MAISCKKKIGLWHPISKKKLEHNRKKKIDLNDKKKFYKNLLRIGYLNKKINKNKLINFVIKAFQRRYRQELINGKLDKECLIISENIVKKIY